MQHIKTYLFLIIVVLGGSKVVYGKEDLHIKNTSSVPANKPKKVKFGFDWKMDVSGNYNWEQEYEIFSEYKFYRGIGIRASIAYVRKSCEAESVVLSGNKDLSTKVNIKSIDVPITIRIYPIPKREGYCLFGGIQLGYIIDGEFNATQQVEFTQATRSWNHKVVSLTLTETSNKLQVQRFQLGIVGGLSYEFRFGLGLGFNIYSGLIDIIKVEKFINTNFNFNLSYNFAKIFR
jgi:hypothetical protein